MRKTAYSALGFNTPRLAAALTLLTRAACGSSPAAERTANAPAQAKTIERVTVDYKGAVTGSEIPDWVQAAVDDDQEAIGKISRFKGKVPIIDYAQGQNLDLLRSWVNNFNVQAAVSRRISNYVEANFGGVQLGDKDTAENRAFIKDVVATCSNIRFNGLAREMDYWIKLRTIDRGRGTETEAYTYYVVYSISEDDLRSQIDAAMGKVTAKTKDQQELKAEVESAMKNAAFNSIQAAE
jgi:hypothetical protein